LLEQMHEHPRHAAHAQLAGIGAHGERGERILHLCAVVFDTDDDRLLRRIEEPMARAAWNLGLVAGVVVALDSIEPHPQRAAHDFE
jgi:hypothetical protein